ncbi:lipid-A-disaccharide synthase-related protein [Synechococcus elongatus]|uniref:lipid-A-disaccharide synthase-related protein n=1 Tax=Synechococcus elongatus TaxID=32046 RepID=UPI0030D2C232
MPDLLFLSNGHGEDLNASLIVQALQQAQPSLAIAAQPIVGAGNAYRKLGVPIIGPTDQMPSGGLLYMNPWVLVRDLAKGLVLLSLQQIAAIWRQRQQFKLVVAVGDIVPIALAGLTGRPFVAFLVSTSSYYEGRLRLPWLTQRLLRSRRCQQIFCRDAFTATDLQSRGFSKAIFCGYPIMDTLQPCGVDLKLPTDRPLIALLAGSRLPEAIANLKLQLQLCQRLARLGDFTFAAAIVPAIAATQLQAIATDLGWQFDGRDRLLTSVGDRRVEVLCRSDAFAEILQASQLVVGMAGTAVEQAVGLGKPVVQIIGEGPQFTYRFAEAQMRLLGTHSVQTVGTTTAQPADLEQAAQVIVQTLQDPNHRDRCQRNGQERVGSAGGSAAIAAQILSVLQQG